MPNPVNPNPANEAQAVIASPLIVAGLVKRRAALARQIGAMHESLRKMVADLENLDATIMQFDPDFKVETIKPKGFRPPSDWSNRMSRYGRLYRCFSGAVPRGNRGD